MTRDNYPLPLIEDQLAGLRGKNYFSTMDLKDGFYHTSFITPLGQFKFLRMPFGLKIGPQRFQRFINNALSDLIKSGEVSVYMDDILVATETLDEHLRVLKKVFMTLVANNLELRLDKCRFVYTEIEYLGYRVTSEGLSPTDNSIEAVLNFAMPKSVRELHTFIGLCSYFRKFIEGFSIIARYLYNLLKKDTTFVFGESQKIAFETLKKKITETPVLAIYDPNARTEIRCDASAQGFGAVLLLQQLSHKMHPVFYFSKRTTGWKVVTTVSNYKL